MTDLKVNDKSMIWNSDLVEALVLRRVQDTISLCRKANAAVIALLATALGVANSTISVTQGATARRKTIHVADDGPVLAATLESWMQSPP